MIVRDHRDRSQHRYRPRGPILRPLQSEPFDLGQLDRKVETGVGPQHRLLGDRHGALGPGAVDRRARQDHEATHARTGRHAQHRPPFVNDAPGRQQCWVDVIASDPKMHQHIRARQMRREVSGDQVGHDHLNLCSPGRRRQIPAPRPRTQHTYRVDALRTAQRSHDRLGHGTGRPTHHHRRHVTTMPESSRRVHSGHRYDGRVPVVFP